MADNLTGVFMADNPMKIKNIYFQISVDDLVRAKEFYEKVFDFVSYHEMSLSSDENVENFLKAL
ncbi:MAG: VOC family protein [Candidatus Heimdallarchaeota archaeon]